MHLGLMVELFSFPSKKLYITCYLIDRRVAFMMEKVDLRQTYQLMQKFCSEEWMIKLDEQSEVRTYKAGATIYWQSEKLESIAIVVKGKVRISSFLKDNSERIYRYATDGQVIGHRGLGQDYFFPISAIALEETEVMKMPLELFETVLRANADFCYHFMLFFAEELKKTERYMSHFISSTVSSRVAQAILINVEYFGYDEEDKQKLAYTISRKDIANLAGTTYETTIRTLSAFQKKGIIELINKEIKIKDIQQLKQLGEGEFESN